MENRQTAVHDAPRTLLLLSCCVSAMVFVVVRLFGVVILCHFVMLFLVK